MGDPDDLARLQDELEQESEMKEMLQESVCDLRNTMTELEERLNSVNLEGNEWKTRYETQVDLNGQLERQITLVHERLEDLKGNPMDRLASMRFYDEIPVDALRQRLKVLTSEKAALQGQLIDCRLRIEQEGKAFHKANDERRAYLSEIAKLSSTPGCHQVAIPGPATEGEGAREPAVPRPATQGTREPYVEREADQ